ncbi:MAG: heterodisulfide reductase [SAR202 cluster bacterium]|nr:heterodisulfide reductase [SAR202 cluster bacterium]
MKYAFYPGCVARGAAPELFASTIEVARRLGIELDYEPMRGASCTGAGVLQEKNQRLGDTLNARTFAMAEKAGLPLMVICSTCQGVMSQASKRFKDDPAYLAEINKDLAEEGLQYKGTVEPKHLLWAIIEDIGIDKLKAQVVKPLKGMKLAPFYGCYIVRPSAALGFAEHPEREDSLEQVIKAVGAEVVDFRGKTLCCGFPILTINQNNALKMVANHTLEAKGNGADAMVTPCPLCHLNLDGYQPAAAGLRKQPIDMPIIHLPQMLGMAMGIEPKALKLNKHLVSTKKLLSDLVLAP